MIYSLKNVTLESARVHLFVYFAFTGNQEFHACMFAILGGLVGSAELPLKQVGMVQEPCIP